MSPLTATATLDWLRKNAPASAHLTTDSRKASPGDVFMAYPGAVSDGRRFIGDAIARGVAAVVWDPADAYQWNSAWNVAQRSERQLKRLCGPIAAQWYGHPSHRLISVGITGTSGKSSSALWLAQAFELLGRKSAYIGTLGAGHPGALEDADNTTPDPARLQRMLADFVGEGVELVAMEVSSIGLEEGRVDGMHYDVALFCNLSRDHLDYHATMERYEAAKSRLFEWPDLRYAIVNNDDPAGPRIANIASAAGATVLTFGMSAPGPLFCRAREITYSGSGMKFVLEGEFGTRHFATPLLGSFNVSNLLGVCCVLLGLGFEIDAALDAMRKLRAAPGRLERVESSTGPLVLVDYAHKPDALEKALEACRPMADARGGRLVTVFGCGGDRDPGKRAIMGEIASRLADLVIVTNDNPRSEKPEVIVNAILSGADTARPAMIVQLDRRAAIEEAIRSAHSSDVVLIAGKGHETYQEVRGQKLPFSDVLEASRVLKAIKPEATC